MSPKRKARGGGPGGAPSYSSPRGQIINVVEPPPSPILEEVPTQHEVDPRFRWPTPSPEPEHEPEPEIDTKILDAVKDSYPYQAEIHFKAIQKVVKENCPGSISIAKAEIDPKMLGIIQKRICQIEVDSLNWYHMQREKTWTLSKNCG
jgi:hypothetical protein